MRPRHSCPTGKKNKTTSLAGKQEKPYIDAGDPRVKEVLLSLLYIGERLRERERERERESSKNIVTAKCFGHYFRCVVII